MPLPVGAPSDWVSLGPASRLLGVDPDTLRRWADAGRIRAFATPGGHRRFSRADLDRLATARRPGHRALSTLGATPDRVRRAYARSYRADGSPAGLERFGGDARAALRTEGRRLVAVLLAYLDAARSADQARWEAEAMTLIGTTAARLADAGATTSEVVEIYLRARRPLLGELGALGRRRALEATELAALFERAVGLLDRLLLHLVATYTAVTPTVTEVPR
ncbi:MAG: helix-turn-helix domain-containing protein [Chloroflexi bacterium]|nr:helix-turn-helix domain-containing protein [Chloroflexota bacterium]